MAEKESCACEGVRVYKEMMQATIDGVYGSTPELSARKGEIAQKLYDHLFFHLNKPENKALLDLSQKKLNDMRLNLSSQILQPGLKMDAIRDAIHKTPALQQALVCGGPYKSEDERLYAAKVIGKVAEWMDDDDTLDGVIPELEKLQKTLGCHVGLNPHKFKDFV